MTKRILLVAMAALGYWGASAQKLSKPTLSTQDLTFGAAIGPNLSGAVLLKDPDQGSDAKGSPGVGFQLGVFAEMPINQSGLSFRPRLEYQHVHFSATVFDQKFPVHASMVKLPLDIVYRPNPKDNPWFFGVGPYVAMALGGKYKFNAYTEDIGFGSDPNADMSKKFDAGLDFLAGYQLTDHIFVSGDLDLGVLNVVNDKFWGPGYKGHALVIGLNVGYVLGK